MKKIEQKEIRLIGRFISSIGILVFYFWFISGPDMKRMIDEYKIITGHKTIVKGEIINAKEFEEEVEKNDGRSVDIVQGYTYTYTFRTTNNLFIKSESGNYGELPINKSLSDIPYKVEVEYLTDNPNLNRIKDLWSNDTNLFEWFRHMVLSKLLVFLVCLIVCYFIIKSGIKRYKTEKMNSIQFEE